MSISDQSEKIYIPLNGEVIPLQEVKDEMFSQKVLGEGVAIVSTNGKLIASCDGTIKMVFDNKHAIGMETTEGAEILFHVGINTVELEGKYYDCKVQAGDIVKQGDLLLEFNVDKVKQAGFDCTTPIIITNSSEYKVQVITPKKAMKEGVLMAVERK